MPSPNRSAKLAAAIAGLTVTAGSLMAQITVVNTGSLVSPTADDPKTAVLSFDAGATADKLIVQVSAEGQDVASITYQGVTLSEAVGASGRTKGIFYLDNPFTGGAADLSVTMGVGNSNGIAVGVVSISGAAPGFAVAALDNGAASVTLTVPVNGSFVVGGYAANGGGTITLPAGHTALYNSSNIGSAHAAGSHANGQPAGSLTYSYADTNPTSPVTAAAVFVPATAAPAITDTSPTAGATAVAADANLIVTFSETIQKGTGNITIHKADGAVFETIGVTTAAVTVAGGTVTINPANDFAPGAGYYVLIDSTAFQNAAGQSYAGIADPVVWNFTTLPDLATVDGRLEWMVQQNITDPWPDPNSAAAGTRSWGLACYALAAFHLGTDLATANSYINDFHNEFPVPDSDTIDFDAYFKLQLIWRIYHDPAMNALLTPQARANIEDMMWRWIRTRSMLSEAQGDTWVYHDSENHDAMQKGGFLLCAEALKDAPGYGPDLILADGRTLSEHAAEWSDYFQRYFIGRAREGINAEIASPIYAKYTVGVYYNLMDFAESPVLCTLAGRFISLYWADTASDWTSSGVRGGGETRCYKDNYLRLGSQYSFDEILWGYGWHASAGAVRTYGLIPATSAYRVPEIITACATDPARPNYLYTSRRWGRTSGSVGDDNFITFDNGDSNLRRDTWVTPAYTMGTLTFDMNRDYLQIIDQNRAMGVMFASGRNDRVMVFGKGAASNDKSYADLSGVTREDCMVVQRDKNANSSGNGTMVFVAQKLWDTRVETGGWLFVRTADAYCAIRPAGGGYTAAIAAHGVDLEMGDLWAPVIIQTGQATGYADFAAFQASVLANSLSYTTGTLNYTSEAGDTFTFFANSKTTPRVNGTTVNLNPAKTYDSPYLSMVHGENLATISYPGYEDLLLDFDTGDIRVAASAANGITDPTGTTNTISGFTVAPGSNRKLVLAASWESGSPGISATWNGSESFTVAVNSAGGRNSAILYLDDPTPGTGDIVVTFPGATGSRVGVLSLVGTADGVAITSITTGTTGSLAVPVDGSLVVGVYTSNDLPTITGPFPSTLYNGGAGSSAGNAGYQTVPAAGPGNYTWTVSAPVSDNNALAAFVPVAAAPVIVGTGPTDNAIAVPVDANLVATFSEPVVAGAGTIELWQAGGGSPVESFDVTSSSQLTFDGQNLTIDPSGNLDPGVGYYVLIDSGAVVDTSGGDAFTGISDTTAWRFTTAGIAGNTFADWISDPTFGLSLADQDLGDDPDGDGIANGVENFFGTHPGSFSRGLVAGTAGPGAGTFTFSHPQGTLASDLSATYRWSSDLATFHPGGETSGGTTVSFATQPDTPVAGTTTVTATVTGTLPDRLFVDVEVTGP